MFTIVWDSIFMLKYIFICELLSKANILKLWSDEIDGTDMGRMHTHSYEIFNSY